MSTKENEKKVCLVLRRWPAGFFYGDSHRSNLVSSFNPQLWQKVYRLSVQQAAIFFDSKHALIIQVKVAAVGSPPGGRGSWHCKAEWWLMCALLELLLLLLPYTRRKLQSINFSGCFLSHRYSILPVIAGNINATCLRTSFLSHSFTVCLWYCRGKSSCCQPWERFNQTITSI